VENAIWHGLMHKEEKGQWISKLRGDNYLYFRITDNGIGREKAAEFASKSGHQNINQWGFALRRIVSQWFKIHKPLLRP
jgi:sensor histidine kinase YesM